MKIVCLACQSPLTRMVSIEEPNKAEFRTRCSNLNCNRQVSVTVEFTPIPTSRPETCKCGHPKEEHDLSQDECNCLINDLTEDCPCEGYRPESRPETSPEIPLRNIRGVLNISADDIRSNEPGDPLADAIKEPRN